VDAATGAEWARRLARSGARREALATEGSNAYRLLNGEADGVPGLTVDRFEDVYVLSSYGEDVDLQARAEGLGALLAARAVYIKRRPREARVEATTRRDALAPAAPAFGSPVDALVAVENGLRYEIRPGQGLSVGLYLDMRDTRAWVRSAFHGRSVLNLFAYTCGFAVAAVAGGAVSAVNVDTSRHVLDWGEKNARHNGQVSLPAGYVVADAATHLRRLARWGNAFDAVILDPPSFSTYGGRAFSAARDYRALARLAAAVVAPRGLLVACCNLARLSSAKFLAQVEAGARAAGRRPRLAKRLGASDVDFPAPKGAESPLKVLIYELT
jgi:23S rRNA (cytosine1962-C5)-methyltransferase